MNFLMIKVAGNRGIANGVGLWWKTGQDRLPLLPEEPENERDDDGDEDAGGKGEIEGKGFPFDVDIAGEFTQPREFACKSNDCADYCDHKSDDNQPLPHLLHAPIAWLAAGTALFRCRCSRSTADGTDPAF